MRRKIGVIALVLCVVLVGSCGVETWHSFVWFGARSKQAEPKANLRGLCAAQRALLEENHFSPTYRGLGTPVSRHNRYAYFVAPGGALEQQAPDPDATGVQIDPVMVPRVLPSEADLPPLLGGLTLGANGECPNCTWVMAAMGSIDTDPELDVWSVSTAARLDPDGRTVDPCVPYLEHDDIPAGPISRLFQ